jgi:hypothetical protein
MCRVKEENKVGGVLDVDVWDILISSGCVVYNVN